MGRFWRFWTHEIPQLVWESRRSFATAFAVFMVAFAVGVISCKIDPDFPRRILGDHYVDETISNIQSGDPMKIYKQDGALGMSLGIAANNLFVALLTFVFGSVWGLGTLYFLVFNGIMVGAFQWFFIEKGVGLQSFLAIWTHGALEISAIVIAGAAGLELSRGLLFPGTLTRGQAFRLSANRGFKVFISITPVLLMAAFFEGFLTRHTELPNLQRGIFIAVCFVFIGIYFVWLPWARAQRGDFAKPLPAIDLPPTQLQSIEFETLRSSGEIFAESFVVLKKNLAFLVKGVLGAVLFSWLYMYFSYNGVRSEMFQYYTFLGIFKWIAPVQFFAGEKIGFLWIMQGLVLTILSMAAFYVLKQEKSEKSDNHENLKYLAQFAIEFLSTAVVMLPVSWLLGNGLVLGDRVFLLLLFFVASLLVSTSIFEKMSPFSAILRTLRLISADFWKGALLNLMWILTGLMCYFFVSSVIFRQIFELLLWNLSIPESEAEFWATQVQAICSMCIIYGVFVLAMVGGGLLFFALREIREATSLYKKLDEIGTGRAIRGLARE